MIFFHGSDNYSEAFWKLLIIFFPTFTIDLISKSETLDSNLTPQLYKKNFNFKTYGLIN